jgi:hypothetical protein
MKDVDLQISKPERSPFADWACSHPFYDVVFKWIIQRIFGLSEPSVLLVVGPTGVGKTTLIAHLIQELARRMTAEMQADPSRLHKVYAEAVYIPTRGFNWEGLFTELLEDANEILIDRKTSAAWPPEKPSLKGLASAVNKMLLHHAPPACIIDEGGSFLESDSDESLKRTLEYLKSIGNRSRTHVVIFGDYRLAKMVQFSGQLNRRCHVTHFANYPEGYEAQFNLVVGSFDARLRALRIQADLTSASDLLFKETCGCVGLMKRWLENTWLDSQPQNRVIDRSALEATPIPVGALLKWRAEIASGHDAIRSFFEGPAHRK